MKRVVNVEIYLSEISNFAISKLTRDQICGLGLMSAGICTYQGALKKRVRGFKTSIITDRIQHFEDDNVRWEVIKIVQRSVDNEYAVRLFNKHLECYEDFYSVLAPVRFFKYTTENEE